MDQPGDIDARSPPNAGRPKLQELGAESARSFVSNAASTLEWLHSNPETEEEEKLYQFPGKMYFVRRLGWKRYGMTRAFKLSATYPSQMYHTLGA